MRPLVPTVLCVAIAVTGVPSASATPAYERPASARDTPGCVSKAEYRQTHKGLHKRWLERRLYDTGGWRDRDGRPVTFRYGFCKPARPQAHAKDFAVRYNVASGKRIVRAKYCGPTWKKRRHCF